MDVNKEKKERLNILLPDGTKAKMRGYAKRNRLKDISVLAREAIFEKLKMERTNHV